MTVSFREVMARWDWRPIPGCPGRFKLRRSSTPPSEIADGLPVERYESAGAADPVLVVRLADGGLISYERSDGTFVHTLGDEAGFARKLAELAI